MEKSKMSSIAQGNIFEVEAISSSVLFFAKKNPCQGRKYFYWDDCG